MTTKMYTIHSTDVLQYSDEYLKENLICNRIPENEITEQMLWDERYDMANTDADIFWWEIRSAEKNIDAEGYLIEADLGLWHGRRSAWATAKTLKEAIQKCIEEMDDWKIEETGKGKLIVTGYHHDGTNHYEIYRLPKAPSLYDGKPGKRNWRNVHLRKAFGWI